MLREPRELDVRALDPLNPPEPPPNPLFRELLLGTLRFPIRSELAPPLEGRVLAPGEPARLPPPLPPEGRVLALGGPGLLPPPLPPAGRVLAFGPRLPGASPRAFPPYLLAVALFP